jgi:pyruvate,water dikinase
VIRLLQTYLAQERAGPAQITAERAAQRLVASAKVAAALTPSPLLRHLPLPTRARCFRLLLAATQGAIRLRERARMKQALLYTRLRHVALALGERWVEQQALQARDDVFYLTIDEAIALAQGDAALAPELRATIASRRADFLACEAMSPPDQFSLAAGDAWAQDSASAPDGAQKPGATLKGIGACGGSVFGPAAVVLDVTQADTLSVGTILVTRQTDPGWAAVFFLVKGLVVERGGMLSHGAIIAREYGIPAVVGVRGATQLIRNGNRLHVDGDAGLVELHDA